MTNTIPAVIISNDMEERNDNDIEIETTEAEEPTIEDTELTEEESRSEDKLKGLRNKLGQCEKDKMTAMEDLSRARADFLNARRRLDEEKLADRERNRLQFIQDILPLCDSFNIALDDPAFKELPDNLQKGILGINKQLSSIVKNYNVVEVGEAGEKFDPNIHEALANNGAGDTVKKVLQKGYKTGDRIIRPAKVIVG